MHAKLRLVIYSLLIFSIALDLATTALCFYMKNHRDANIEESNIFYRHIGFWSFPVVLCIDLAYILIVEWLRKRIWWSPLILLILVVAYLRAGIGNLILLLSL